MQLKLNELLVWNIVLQKDINMSSQGASVLVSHFEILSASSYITSFRKISPFFSTKMMHVAISLRKVRIGQSYDDGDLP